MEALRCLLQGGRAGGKPSALIRGADGNEHVIPLPKDAGVMFPELASEMKSNNVQVRFAMQ